MKPYLLLVAIVAAGCVPTTPTSVRPYQPSASQVARAEAAIADLLKDPASMQTRRVTGYRTENGDEIICGEYNSRNGFGGYAGFSTFYVRFLPNGTMKRLADESGDIAIAAAACGQASSGVINLPD